MIASINSFFWCSTFLAAAISIASCSEGGAERTAESEQILPRSPTTICVAPSHAPSSQCVAYCPPDEISISIDEFSPDSLLTCTGYGGAEACAGNEDYQAFVFDSEDLYLYFSFDPSIIGNYSSTAFTDTFGYLNATIKLPDSANFDYYHQTREPIRTGDPRLVSLSYDKGRLLGHVDLGGVTRISRRIESRERTCIEGDIMGMCTCVYEVRPIPVDIKFSLAVPQSGAISNEKYLALAEEAVLSGYPVQYLENAKFACNKMTWFSEVGYSCQTTLDQRYGLRITVVQRENRWDVVDVSRYDRDD